MLWYDILFLWWTRFWGFVWVIGIPRVITWYWLRIWLFLFTLTAIPNDECLRYCLMSSFLLMLFSTFNEIKENIYFNVVSPVNTVTLSPFTLLFVVTSVLRAWRLQTPPCTFRLVLLESNDHKTWNHWLYHSTFAVHVGKSTLVIFNLFSLSV